MAAQHRGILPPLTKHPHAASVWENWECHGSGILVHVPISFGSFGMGFKVWGGRGAVDTQRNMVPSISHKILQASMHSLAGKGPTPWRHYIHQQELQCVLIRQLRARRALSIFKDVLLKTRRALSIFKDVLLRTRRALSIFKDVPLRTRRGLSLCKVYGDSALLVLNGTSLNNYTCSTLLALNWRFQENECYVYEPTTTYMYSQSCL